MLSNWRWGTATSIGSDLTGVDGGGDASLRELELALEKERADVRPDVVDTELERSLDEELALPLDDSWPETREEKVESAVKKCRIWSLRRLSSSRVIPSVLSSCDMGEAWGFVMVFVDGQ